jgi:hypothetical protein
MHDDLRKEVLKAAVVPAAVIAAAGADRWPWTEDVIAEYVGAMTTFDQALDQYVVQMSDVPKPRRGDAFAEWLKKKRDGYDGQSDPAYRALDDALDDYRLRADTGMWLEEEMHDGD